MGHVVKLEIPFRQATRAARQSALVARFAEARRPRDDVFWLKENAEILNVLESTGAQDTAQALAVHDGFYAEIEKRLGFFPQYYRFLLSICLDLEDLGLAGSKGEALVDWVARQGLAGAELSDLQRAEARRLCLRRGIDPLPDDTGLDARLRAFARRQGTFVLPNKKAAYELTHIVFYLSEYGRRDPGLDAEISESLRFAGTLAFLELNADLLAEICIALRFAGQVPPEPWESWLCRQARSFVVETRERGYLSDDYHPFLMVNWFLSVSGQGGFGVQVPEGPVAFAAPRPHVGALRELSECIFGLHDARRADWTSLRDRVGKSLSQEAQTVLAAAEAAVDFEAFFAGFARAAAPGQGR